MGVLVIVSTSRYVAAFLGKVLGLWPLTLSTRDIVLQPTCFGGISFVVIQQPSATSVECADYQKRGMIL